MRMREFVRQNREEIDYYIREVCGRVPAQASCCCPLSGTDHRHEHPGGENDKERTLWVQSDEGLYRWARSEGVPI
jgi:hypothetical protein